MFRSISAWTSSTATGEEVLYVWEERFLNGELLDFGDTKLQFTDPPSEAFVFNLNVVVGQGVDFFDGGFDDIYG